MFRNARSLQRGDALKEAAAAAGGFKSKERMSTERRGRQGRKVRGTEPKLGFSKLSEGRGPSIQEKTTLFRF
jgi:hypothetical protein